MPEQIQKILDKILEWWKKFNTRQKTLLLSILAAILLALAILAVVVSKPEMMSLYTCSSLKEAGNIKELLTDNGIGFEVSEDGLSFEVEKKDLADARILLGTNSIPTEGPDIASVFDGGFSSTEADKEKKYKVYLQEDLATVLEAMDSIESASIRLDLPNDDGTIISKDEQASVSVMLTLEDELSGEQAAGLAQFLATNVGNDDTSRITIIDNHGNVLFSGDEVNSVAGSANSQMELKAKAESLVKSKIRDVLVGSTICDNAEIAMNLDMDFDERTEQRHEYYAPEGQSNGMIDSKSEYESMSQGGAAATPGTDSNDDTTYVIEDSEITLSTISDVTTDYINNEKITTYVQSVGKINCATSSISIVLTDWVVYKEDVLRASGALDDMTFDEYIVANSEPVKREVDEDYYELVSNATGFPVESITILSYAQPMFEYSSKGNRTLSDYLQLILVIFIFLLLGLVVFRSMRRDQTQEPEAELSVENLLESTKESQEVLADIGYNEKSETRILIEKFVEQNPEAAASLLRNWLNEDWE